MIIRGVLSSESNSLIEGLIIAAASDPSQRHSCTVRENGSFEVVVPDTETELVIYHDDLEEDFIFDIDPELIENTEIEIK